MRLPVGVLLCALLPVFAQTAAGDRVRKLEAALEAERVRQQVVGLTIGLAIQGTRKWTGAFGKADLENDVPVRPSTVFRTGSLAKPMTAIAALQLWERGKLA